MIVMILLFPTPIRNKMNSSVVFRGVCEQGCVVIVYLVPSALRPDSGTIKRMISSLMRIDRDYNLFSIGRARIECISDTVAHDGKSDGFPTKQECIVSITRSERTICKSQQTERDRGYLPLN